MALNACVNAVVQPGRLEAAIQLEILLLKILLSKNINDYNSACEDPQVGLYLYQCCGGKGLNHEKPFFLRSASLSDHCVLSSISSTKRISKVSIILNEAEVLRKILFVVAYDVEVSLSSLSFLDTFFANLPVVPSDGDLQSFTTDKTMSLLDVKILVIAAAEWLYLQCSSQIRPLNYSPPLSRQLLAVWKCVVEESMEKRKINALSKVKLCNALELTRLRGELPDVRVIAKVFIWLEKYGDPNGRMFKHYGHAIDDLENRTLNNIQSSHTFEPILPKKFDDISIEEESNLFKEIHELLTKKENLEVPESFNSSQSSTINCKKSEEDFKESTTAMNPDELIAVATCSEENDGPKVVDVSADKVDIISQSSEDFSAPMVHQPLLKRLKNVADYRLAGSTVELIRVAAVCDLAQDPRRNGFFEAVQCSANNIRNEDRNKSESSHMETGDSTAYLTHFKGVLDDVGRRQYEKLMRMFAMTPPSAP